MRVGFGYDVHKLVPGNELIIGGVHIPYHLKLKGHSDADVLVHAIIDAILGAAALGDIGRHFPDTDEQYKGISSIELLDRISRLIESKGFRIGNVDSVIVAQAPKFAPYIDDMNKNIATVMDVDVRCVNVKATTEEGLGFTGRIEGISAKAVCMLI